MGPPLRAGSLLEKEFTAFISGFIKGGLPAVMSPAAVPANAAAPKEGIAEQARVNAWLLPEVQTTLEQIRGCCIKLLAAQNWEMLEYAVGLVQARLNDLKVNERLLWIISENLDTLVKSKVAYLGREPSKFESLLMEKQAVWGFKPPLENYLGLRKLIAALSTPENAKLEFTKRNLKRLNRNVTPLSQIHIKVITSRPDAPPPLAYFAIPTCIQELWTLQRPLQISTGSNLCFILPISPQDCRFEVAEGFAQNLILEQILACTGLGTPCKLENLSEKACAEWNATDIPNFIQTKHKLDMEQMPAEFRSIYKGLNSAETEAKFRNEDPETLKKAFSSLMNTPGALAQLECEMIDELVEEESKEPPPQPDEGLQRSAEWITESLPEDLKRKYQAQLKMHAKKGDAPAFEKCRQQLCEALREKDRALVEKLLGS